MARKKKKSPARSGRKSLLFTALLLTLVVVTVGATFYVIFLRPGTSPPLKSEQITTKEYAPPEAAINPQPAEKIRQTTQKHLPRIAIIIDDLGNRNKLATKIMALDLNLSFSFLPHTPFAKKLAAKAALSGRDILIHLPMEATDPKWNPGPGSLMLSMRSTEIAATLKEDISEFPKAIGINNHMGSKFSQNKPAMRLFLRTIQDRKLFFIDSLTSAKSVGYDLARQLGVKAAKRDIFLDNVQQPVKIKEQLRRLLARAKTKGHAIGIGHPHPATLAALTDFQDKLRQEVELVGVHELVE